MAVSKQFLESIMETIRVYWSDSEAESDQESPELSDSEGEGDQSGPGSSGGPQSGPGSSERDQGPPTEVHEFQVSKSQCSALKQLLEETVQKPSFKETISRALFKVCERGLHNVAEVLLRFNADVNYTASSGCTPLHVAVKKGDTETVKLLVRNGASLEEEEDCECEMSPLFLACLNKDLECVRTLLDLGADIYDEDFEGRTSLATLLEMSKCDVSPDILELLLERGANPNGTSQSDLPMELMLYGLLWENLNNNEETLEKLCDDCVKVVRLLLQYSFDLQCCGNADEMSLLRLSLENFSLLFPLAGLLLEKGGPFVPNHSCWSRYDVLAEALNSALEDCSEAEARLLVDKANALLDLAIVHTPLEHFTPESTL